MYPRNRLSLVLVTVLWALPCALPAGEKAPADTGKVFLWEVQSAKTTIYLLGSIHVGSRDLYPLDQTVAQAEPGGNRSQRVTRGFGSERRTAREPGIDLNDPIVQRAGVQRKLDVALTNDTKVPNGADGEFSE